MQLFEMQGLLAGKCLPGDIKVNESLAEYFLRQFNQRDELARQVSALQLSHDNIINSLGIKGDGPVSKLVIEYVMGLVAENAIQDFIITAVKDLVRESNGVVGWHLNGDIATWDEVLPELFHSETPATDAAIAEIESVGADKMFNLVEPAVRNFCNPVTTGFIIEELESLAANLRAGRKG